MNFLEALCARLAWLLIMMSICGHALAGTPCAGPQRLCASVDTNTSAPSPLFAMLDPAIQPRPARSQPNEPVPPPPASSPPIRIALLLPMRSSTLATAAEAVRAGFMAGIDRDGTGFKTEVVSTGDAPRDVLDAYARAAVANDIIVGPLARSAVAALADSDAVTRPTVVLSVPEGRTGVSRTTVPRGMLVVGLSIEDEARQVAEWAAREHPHGRALILTGGAAWAQRAAGAFEARWVQLGHTNQRFAVPSGEGGKAAIEELKQKLQIDPPDLLFAALDSAALRPVRALAAATIPCYGGGPANPGRSTAPDVPGLDGVRLLDLPWIVLPDHPAVMVYPRPLNTEQPLDMDRLYALGIDAFRVARELALRDGAPFGVDGVTGRLDVVAGPGGQLQLQRVEAAVVVRGGAFEPVDKGR